MPAKQSVGSSVGRVDGAAKVTGRALYVDDLPAMDGELFGATVRSQVACGRIKSITQDPAFDWSDVTVVTAEDVNENVVQLIEDDQPILADGFVNHRYEPIALLACADKGKLARAAKALIVDIESVAPTFDSSGREQTRYTISKSSGDADIDAAIAACEVVVSGSYSTTHQEQLYIETQGVVAWWDDAGAHATGSLQCPYYVHKAFKRAFSLPPEQIHITQAVTGGGFGGKEEYPSLIALHAALLAKKSGKPVRVIYDRTEDIEATTKRHPCSCEITTGCDKDGTMRALKMEVTMDAGAYVTLTPVVLSRGILHAGGAYRWPDRAHRSAQRDHQHPAERRLPRLWRAADDLGHRTAPRQGRSAPRSRCRRAEAAKLAARRRHHAHRSSAARLGRRQRVRRQGFRRQRIQNQARGRSRHRRSQGARHRLLHLHARRRFHRLRRTHAQGQGRGRPPGRRASAHSIGIDRHRAGHRNSVRSDRRGCCRHRCRQGVVRATVHHHGARLGAPPSRRAR